MNLYKLASLFYLAGVIAISNQAQATIIIDDWDVDQSIEANSSVVGVSDTVSRLGTSNGGSFWGSRGNAYAHLIRGDEVTTNDCSNCLQGHGTNASNSLGNGFWEWIALSPTNMHGGVSLFYDADIAGGDLVATFIAQ